MTQISKRLQLFRGDLKMISQIITRRNLCHPIEICATKQAQPKSV